MNDSQSSSSTFNYIGATEPKSVSPCEQAYDNLHALQESQAEIVTHLADRLNDVLRTAPPEAANNAGAKVGEAPQSELHGRLLAAADRTRTINSALNDMLQRLTV